MVEVGDAGPVDVVAPDVAVLDEEFQNEYGALAAPYFLAWTSSRVYFAVSYDGLASVGSAPRHPQDLPERPVRGGAS
jgi:hypothetical protein